MRVGFEEQVADAVDALAAIPGIEKEQADALVHAGLLTLDSLIGVEAEDLADIPGLADHAETVLSAAKAEKERRAGTNTDTPTEESATEFEIGEIKVETTSTPDEEQTAPKTGDE